MNSQNIPRVASFYRLQSPTHYILTILILEVKKRFILGFNHADVSLESLKKRLKENLSEIHGKFTIGFIDPECGVITILDDYSLQYRLDYIEQKCLMHEFVVEFQPSASPRPASDNADSEMLREPSSSVTANAKTTKSPENLNDWTAGSFHVMLSYSWADQPNVIAIKSELEKRGLAVWMDLNEITKNIFCKGFTASTPPGDSALLSPHGFNDSMIHLRNDYSFPDQKKPFVPIHMRDLSTIKGMIMLEAMKLITAGELYLDLSKLDWTNSVAVGKEMDILTRRVNERILSLSVMESTRGTFPSASEIAPQWSLAKWLQPVSMDDENDQLQKDYAAGTRLWLIAEVRFWIETPSSRVLWLNGGAGVGKSMMSYLVSTKIPPNWFGAIFYCRHNDSNKNKAVNVLKTIAYELSKKCPEYYDFLVKLQFEDNELQKDGKDSILDSSVSAVYQSLLIDGLKAITTKKPLVIVIDALDECGQPGQVERAELLSIVHESTTALPSFVKLIVTGRPEPDIWNSLYDINAHILETASELNMQDLRIFSKLRLARLGSFTTEEINKALEALTTKSEGVFVYARLACDAIESTNPQNITTLMGMIAKLHTGMDSIYDSIFETCNSPTVRTVIATICKLQKPLTMKEISNLLHISEPQVGGVHIALRSILRTGEDGGVTVIHKSLMDFVTTPGRSSSIDFTSINIDFLLAERCFEILRSEIRFNIANFEQKHLYTWHKDIPNFSKYVSSVPGHIRYAALYATSHLNTLSFSLTVIDDFIRIHKVISDVVRTKLTCWMELLSLLDRFSDIIRITGSLRAFYMEDHRKSKLSSDDTTSKSLFEDTQDDLRLKSEPADLSIILSLLTDAQQICGQFATPISASALQVYWTAILFSPAKSSFHQTYFKTRPPGSGHRNAVRSVAISKDGNSIVSGSEDHSIKVWDAKTGEEIRSLSGHDDYVNAVAVSHEGCLVVSGSEDALTKIWNLHTGKEIRTLSGHENWINSVAISVDGSLILSGSDDKTVKLWNRTTGYLVHTFSGHRDWVYAVAICGRLIVSGSKDRTVKLWSVNTGKELRTLKGHSGAVRSVAVGDHGNLIVSGSEDKTLKVWDTNSGEEMGVLIGHTNWVTSVAISHDESLIVSGSDDATVKLWDVNTFSVIRNWTGHSDWVNSVAINSNENLIVSGSKDGTLRLWDAIANKNSRKLTGHRGVVKLITISNDGLLVASGSKDSTVKLWDANTGTELRTFAHDSTVRAVVITVFLPVVDPPNVKIKICITMSVTHELSPTNSLKFLVCKTSFTGRKRETKEYCGSSVL
ncbi:POC1 centriolar protein A [Nowakowskiella sp. JEL0407]|nr:POC1 centriolar protein A [Nowakowskiella sp. JEL0407]